ncbi:MAG: hypothetical protein CM1200mP14_20380 [Gammaproteobacteria bacterium]|nr:MAG: hypothetical protein CM1200mP14_20380 [Gammaproteobacteria bacterium]
MTLALPGPHSVVNALISLAISEWSVLGPEMLSVVGLAEVSPLRSEIRQIGDVRVIADCYNSNPQSLRAHLRYYCPPRQFTHCSRPGTMLELGNEAARLHEETLEYALDLNIDLVVATGGSLKLPRRWKWTSPRLFDPEIGIGPYPGSGLAKGDKVLLLKASRGMLRGDAPSLGLRFR